LPYGTVPDHPEVSFTAAAVAVDGFRIVCRMVQGFELMTMRGVGIPISSPR